MHSVNLEHIIEYTQGNTAKLELILKHSQVNTPIEHKIKIWEMLTDIKYDSILREQGSQQKTAYIIVLGTTKDYLNIINDQSQSDYFYWQDKNQDLFDQNPINIYSKNAEERLLQTRYFDNAVFIDKNGNIIYSGVTLNVDPVKIARQMGLIKNIRNHAYNLSDIYGFKIPVHNRHHNSIAFSKKANDGLRTFGKGEGVSVYTLSEENRIMRMYEEGRIIYSTCPGEAKILDNNESRIFVPILKRKDNNINKIGQNITN
ncbi:MAG: hypothetical protein QXG00_03115 [Candidatus Woesearchaeota archaeon]